CYRSSNLSRPQSFALRNPRAALLQLRVFRLGRPQNGDVGVGVFPEREEILIGGAGFGEGGTLWHGRLARGAHGRDGRATYTGFEGVSAGQSEAGQRAPGKVHHHSSVVDE